MTALTRYARIEATALWRAAPDAQRQEVIVSIGDATLVISNLHDRPLTHWSLAAVARANPGENPAIYHPDGDPGETLEIAEDETDMIEAIETLRRAITRARPRPGRLRVVGLAVSVVVVAALALFWLPGAMRDHTLRVVPGVKRVEIGLALLDRIERVSGPACSDTAGRAALALLSKRLSAGKLAVLPDMTRESLHLPGGLILLDRGVIEDFEEPDVAAGYVLTEMTRRAASDPLRDLLDVVGLRENFRLLTTGDIAPKALDRYAEHLVATESAPVAPAAQLARFAQAEVRSTPYAYARDITGETTLPLIEGDPMAGKLTAPLMSDANWLRLQSICGG
ncbi:hypothetical protein FIU94_01175 [Sulfitobacter sp. THAF37]|uniref:hypothetical protein n=1 Tax=Sulfitobacter sp. THAF37 TaxID=2587855 RepID=UPI00126852F3|nr:hypothetical protein [Sulfitobacter sp. THAF37]QFT57420.1 hypothetical protein FIU94_01175 [Sulfitobacter sp. THAF37]